MYCTHIHIRRSGVQHVDEPCMHAWLEIFLILMLITIVSSCSDNEIRYVYIVVIIVLHDIDIFMLDISPSVYHDITKYYGICKKQITQ